MFLGKAMKVHGNKYKYEIERFEGTKKKVKIFCQKHGWFLQEAGAHLSGKGCIKCAREKNDSDKRFTQEQIIERFRESKGDDFNYSRVNYVNFNTKVTIGCMKHGWFEVTPNQFLTSKYGCHACWMENIGKSNRRIQEDDFKKKASALHNNKYIYDKVHFNSVKDKVLITCPIHGDFEQIVYSHLKGIGCAKCKNFSGGEQKIERILGNLGVLFLEQYKIPNNSVFCKNKNIYIDFFIPSISLAIEFNGKQHYAPIKYYGGEKAYNEQKERDYSLKKYCKEHKIKLIEIPYTEYKNIEEILKKELKVSKNRTKTLNIPNNDLYLQKI